jgi:hypothetical protein
MFFDYPALPHTRRHGPRGYQDYKLFKPWLRDERHSRTTDQPSTAPLGQSPVTSIFRTWAAIAGTRCPFCFWRHGGEKSTDTERPA